VSRETPPRLVHVKPPTTRARSPDPGHPQRPRHTTKAPPRHGRPRFTPPSPVLDGLYADVNAARHDPAAEPLGPAGLAGIDLTPLLDEEFQIALPDSHPLARRDRVRLKDLRAETWVEGDRKSTRLNSSHVKISYAVFCLKK